MKTVRNFPREIGKSLIAFSQGRPIVIMSDVPSLESRYGHGKPPHPALQECIGHGREAYRATLERILADEDLAKYIL